MKLSRAGVWDITLVENSCIIQLFNTLNCLGGWPAFIVALWEHSFDQRTHILPPASPFFLVELHSSSLRTHLYHFIPLTICTQVPFTSEALRLYITVIYKFAYMEYIF